MAIKEDLLGQLRPANTSAASLYSPTAPTKRWIGKTLKVCNTSGATAKYRIFHSKEGTTYDESTAQEWDVVLNKDVTHTYSDFLAGSSTSGNFGVRTSVANAITFTLYGANIE